MLDYIFMHAWGVCDVMYVTEIFKQLDRHASLNHNIYIADNPTPVDVDHGAYVCHFIVRPQFLLSESWRPSCFRLIWSDARFLLYSIFIIVYP